MTYLIATISAFSVLTLAALLLSTDLGAEMALAVIAIV